MCVQQQKSMRDDDDVNDEGKKRVFVQPIKDVMQCTTFT